MAYSLVSIYFDSPQLGIQEKLCISRDMLNFEILDKQDLRQDPGPLGRTPDSGP